MEVIKKFLADYLNCNNAFYVIGGGMLIFLILYIILSATGTHTLKKIIKIMRKESGNDIIRKIEGMRLSKRYRLMWEDYYTAFCDEETVALNNYLIKNDLFVKDGVLKQASRAVAIAGFALTLAGIYNISGIGEKEKTELICLFFILAALQAVFEAFYALFAKQREKRIARLTEEFEMLSLRKLPGKAVSFQIKHINQGIKELDERLDAVRAGINQVNARLDREYRFLEKSAGGKAEE